MLFTTVVAPPCRSWPIQLSLLAGILGSAAPVTLPASCRAAEIGSKALEPRERETLRRYARDTWNSFEEMSGGGQLPADGLCRNSQGKWEPTKKTTPTDVGAYIWSTLAAESLGLVDAREADRRVEKTLGALAGVERRHGFFFDRLDPRNGTTLTVSPYDGKPIRLLLSTVDNGWLAAALIMVANTRPALRAQAEALCRPMDFRFFFEPHDPADPARHPGQLLGSYRPDRAKFGTTLGLINTEPRIASYIGIAWGQLPAEHYYRLYRSLPPSVGQQQVPEGRFRTYRDIKVFEGHYSYRGMRIVPSWGGSMFEALMVPLFVPEDRWAPKSWGVNHPLYVRAQLEHGLIEARYGFWGFSPACRPRGGYRTYGVDALGTDTKGYTSNDREIPAGAGKGPEAFANGVVTPHASFLALRFAPHETMANLRALEDRFPIYGTYGFLDSVDTTTGVVADCVLALDQGIIMAAIANALGDDVLQHAFSDGFIEKAIRPLMAPEEFTAGPAPAT